MSAGQRHEPSALGRRRGLAASALFLLMGSLGCQELRATESRSAPAASVLVGGGGSASVVVVRAQQQAGAPLHDGPRDSRVSGRLPDATRVRVLEQREGGRWLLVRSSNGLQGWLSRRYVLPHEKSTSGPASARHPDASSPWFSRAACEKALATGQRFERAPGTARVAAWNIRWFPDGTPGKGSQRDAGTDLSWVACALGYLNADVIALSEIKGYPGARAKLERVLSSLSRATGGDFRVCLDDCTPAATQHVALLWNAARVKAESFETFAELNPRGSACADQLRPGLGARFSFPGGLDLELVAVHLKSGTDERALGLRRRSWQALGLVEARSRARHTDDDLVVLGDFNAMGCPRCSPPVSAEQERAELSKLLAAARAPFAVLGNASGCSHYYGGAAGLLDLAVAPTAMLELGPNPALLAGGLCASLGCQPLPAGPLPALQRDVSDHCPILLDLVDRDLD